MANLDFFSALRLRRWWQGCTHLQNSLVNLLTCPVLLADLRGGLVQFWVRIAPLVGRDVELDFCDPFALEHIGHELISALVAPAVVRM